MAQKTTLSTTATPGQVQAFTAKEAGATGAPPMLDPILLDMYVLPIEIGLFVQPVDLAVIEPIDLDMWIEPVTLDMRVEPIELEMD